MADMPEAVTAFVSLAVTFLTFKGVFVVTDLVGRQRHSETSLVRPQVLHQ
jgi:hypothetical protein